MKVIAGSNATIWLAYFIGQHNWSMAPGAIFEHDEFQPPDARRMKGATKVCCALAPHIFWPMRLWSSRLMRALAPPGAASGCSSMIHLAARTFCLATPA